MTRIAALLMIGSLLTLTACLIKPPPEEPDLWEAVLTEPFLNPIRNIHTSLTQLYAISDDEFIRLDNNNELLERRRLNLPFRFFGRPSLSDQVFVRVTRQDNNDQVIEFHLAKVAGQQVDITFSELISQTGDELFPEDNARYTGAFNADGSQFVIPTLNFSKDIFTFLVFDILLNSAGSAFESVELAKAIDIPDMQNDPKSLSNFKFINGFYYASSQNGGFRINPNGQFDELFSTWMLDFFAFDGQLYATGSGSDLHESTDNGLNWNRVNDLDDPTELRFTEVANEQVFTQLFTGFPFQLSDDDLLKAKDLKFNKDFTADVAAYTNILYFFGRYYITLQKELYFTTDLQTVD